MQFLHTIDDVVETLKNARNREKRCSLLIGAGCSARAHIPTAKEFVEIIRNDYPQAYRRAHDKTYPHCMAELSFGERRDLIGKYVDGAVINWAHIGIAQLMKEGFVDRVLTTNFDPLVARACAMVNVFPAVYDLASSQLFQPEDIHDQAVFHLHGQRTGFAIMNTPSECRKHLKQLAPVFEDAGRGRVWLVVGYSGESDPVFEHLAKVTRFSNRLYWIGYMDDDPPRHVRAKLLVPGKDAFYVGGFDADGFLTTLAQKLSCFPPGFCEKPFSHLEACLDTIAPYPMPGQKAEVDVTAGARMMIGSAKKRFEQSEESQPPGTKKRRVSVAKLTSLLMAGEYDEVIALGAPDSRLVSSEAADAVSWAYVMQGNLLMEQAIRTSGGGADVLFGLAADKYRKAIQTKPDRHEALCSWGLALADQAKQKSREEADALFAMAKEKYKAALEISPDCYEALYNWGVVLADQAKQKSGEEAEALFALAGEKYEAALEIRPDHHEALYNWGIALADQARQKRGEEADALLAMAGEMYKAALEIRPDYHEALNNWGIALADQARQKRGEEADALFVMAGEKYREALEVSPDDYVVLSNWGLALLDSAKQTSGNVMDNRISLAEEKFLLADSSRPGYGCYDLACISAMRDNESDCQAWLKKSLEHGKLPSREHIETDTDLDSVRNTDWFSEFMASLP